MGKSRFCAIAALGLLILTFGTTHGQQSADQQAEVLLNTARKAYGDANFTFATEKFREFLTKFGGHKEINAARYGLGLATRPSRAGLSERSMRSPRRPTTDSRPPALLRVCRAGLGHKGDRGGARQAKRDATAAASNGHFTEAGKFLVRAREEFDKKSPPDGEWSARARCDAAEMELRLGKTKEARTTVEPFVRETNLAKSQFRPLGLYYHGFACFLLNDIRPAARSLNQLAPFDQPFGLHARYLMGRIHAAQDEKAEAALAFTAVLTSYEEQKKSAVEALKQPDRFKHDPWEKSRLEALVQGPAPDYVAGAAFHGRA